MSELVVQSRGILQTHARSFSLAALFLPADRRDAAAVLYALCRLVDDLADEHGDADALDALDAELRGDRPPRPLVAACLDIVRDARPLTELVEGARSDLGVVRFADDRALLRYAYRVAGTVGLLMCDVLGVDDPTARPHAIDLGVAMQITNICRDVLEDAGNGRVYLPADRLARAGTSPGALLDGSADPAAVGRVVADLLDLAEGYYASADAGMRFIPARSRLAVVVASRVYRGIGLRLRRRPSDALVRRTVVPWWEKAAHVITATAALPRLARPARSEHDRALHRHLGDLPGAHA